MKHLFQYADVKALLYNLVRRYPSTRLIAIDESIKLNLLSSLESVEVINYSSNGIRNFLR